MCAAVGFKTSALAIATFRITGRYAAKAGSTTGDGLEDSLLKAFGTQCAWQRKEKAKHRADSNGHQAKSTLLWAGIYGKPHWFFLCARYNDLVMSERTVEDTIIKVTKLLEDIGNAVRVKDDVKIKTLCGEAARYARDLEQARREMHSYWED